MRWGLTLGVSLMVGSVFSGLTPPSAAYPYLAFCSSGSGPLLGGALPGLPLLVALMPGPDVRASPA
jgi:hypothetical protein